MTKHHLQKAAKSALKQYDMYTDADKIVGFLTGTVDDSEIKEQDLRKIDQVTTARSLMFQYKRPSIVVPMLEKTFSIKKARAYQILKLAELIYGKIDKVSNDLRRQFAEDMIEETKKKAKDLDDAKSMAACDANYIKLHSLDKPDTDLPDLSNFDKHHIIVAVLPEQVGENPPPEEELLKKVSDWISDQAEDVDFEEVKDGQ